MRNDTSDFSIEVRLVAAVWLQERPHTGQTIKENIMNNFVVRFGMPSPTSKT